MAQQELKQLDQFVKFYKSNIQSALKSREVEDVWLSRFRWRIIMKHQVLGTLVGNTGEPHNLHMVLNSSFSGRRGEFVRIRHQERQDEPVTHVLGRIVSIQQTNMLFNSGFGNSVSELELLPGAEVTGEHVYATIDLVGYKDATTNQIKIPRRPLDPGSKLRQLIINS